MVMMLLFHFVGETLRQLGRLGSFGESSLASRRKRGPVAFRPHLSAGLALSLFSSKRMDADSHQLQLQSPAKKPAFFIGK